MFAEHVVGTLTVHEQCQSSSVEEVRIFQTEMAATIVDIVLSEEETDTFIDLFEQNPCLWNAADPSFKNRNGKAAAK